MPNPPTIDEMAESLSTSDLRREARRLFFEDSDRDAITLDYIMEFWPVYRIALEEHLKELGQGDVVWPELGSELELGVRVPGGFDGIEEVEVERDLRRRYAVMIINESLPEQLQGIVRTGDGLAEEWRKLDGFLSSYRACRDVLREDDPKNSVRLGSTPLPWWLQGASCFRLRTVDNLYDSRMSIWQLTSLLAIYTSVVGFLVLVLALLLRAEYFKMHLSGIWSAVINCCRVWFLWICYRWMPRVQNDSFSEMVDTAWPLVRSHYILKALRRIQLIS